MITVPFATPRAKPSRARADRQDLAALNAALFDRISQRNSTRSEEAADAVNDFTRSRMREDSFLRRIMPPIQITNDMLDRSVATNQPTQ